MPIKRMVTAVLLENQEKAIKEERDFPHEKLLVLTPLLLLKQVLPQVSTPF